MALLPNAQCPFCPRTTIWVGDTEDGYADRLCHTKKETKHCPDFKAEEKRKQTQEHNRRYREKKKKQKMEAKG